MTESNLATASGDTHHMCVLCGGSKFTALQFFLLLLWFDSHHLSTYSYMRTENYI